MSARRPLEPEGMGGPAGPAQALAQEASTGVMELRMLRRCLETNRGLRLASKLSWG